MASQDSDTVEVEKIREKRRRECEEFGDEIGWDSCKDSKNPPSPTPTPPGDPSGSGSSSPAGTFDPNDKFFPAGYGDVASIQANSSLPYQVRFEDGGATAPGEADHRHRHPRPQRRPRHLRTHRDLLRQPDDRHSRGPRPLHRYGANEDPHRGRHRGRRERGPRPRRAHSDPDAPGVRPPTGTFSDDPLVGLLYPNDDTRRGEGSISYLVRPGRPRLGDRDPESGADRLRLQRPDRHAAGLQHPRRRRADSRVVPLPPLFRGTRSRAQRPPGRRGRLGNRRLRHPRLRQRRPLTPFRPPPRLLRPCSPA